MKLSEIMQLTNEVECVSIEVFDTTEEDGWRILYQGLAQDFDGETMRGNVLGEDVLALADVDGMVGIGISNPSGR